MNSATPGLTASRLREVVHYDQASGVFTAGVRLSMQVRAGHRLGSADRRGYRQIRLFGKAYYEHRLAFLYVLGRWPSEAVDHVDGAKGNNAWNNLREATAALNMQNQHHAHSRNKAGKLGVRSHKGKFQAKIKVGSKSLHLGTFGDANDAHAAYLAAKKAHHPFGQVAN